MPPESACTAHFHLISDGIRRYEAAHGDLRPVIMGPGLYPQSWRAAIAPYTVFPFPEECRYQATQPWDSPENREALPSSCMVLPFTCEAEASVEAYPFTSYLMLVRSDSDDRELAESLPPSAVIIVESASCGIEFAEPRDLMWDGLWEGESPFGKGKLNSFHPRVVKALRKDGRVIDIPKNITNEALRTLLSGRDSG